jgi:hypothetical protein
VYNKLFTKIVDSSIWLESMPTRIVWLTFIAVMDEDGFCPFASAANVAHRARVSLDEAEIALECLTSPDPNSSNPDHEGRRLERVPGGWLVMNAKEHRMLITRQIQRENIRRRVQRHRALKRTVTQQVLPVTLSNPSEAYAEAEANADREALLNVDRDIHNISPQGRVDRARATDVSSSPPIEAPNEQPKTGLPTSGAQGNPQTLINGRSQRLHGQHAWCSLHATPEPRDGLCVPYSLHDELKGKTLKSDDDLKAFYNATVNKYAGQGIADNLFEFWQNEVAAWIGTVSVKASNRREGRGARLMAATERVIAGQLEHQRRKGITNGR